MSEDEIDNTLQALAKKHDTDFEELKEQFEEKLEEGKGRTEMEIPEEKLIKWALRAIASQFVERTRLGGEVEQVGIMAVGHYGLFPEWGKENKQVVVALGAVNPPNTEDENRPAGVGVFIIEGNHGLDLDDIREKFQWGNPLEGWFTVRRSDDFGGRSRTYYILNSGEESRVADSDDDSWPSDPDKIRAVLHNNFIKEEASMASIHEALSLEDGEFGSNWLDVRKIEGSVVDVYRDFGKDFGKYTIIDDNYVSPEDLEGSAEFDHEQQSVPGLQCFIPPEMVKYGTDSQVVLYGTVSKHPDRGTISMNACGVAPVLPFPYDGPENEDEGGDADDVETETL